MRCRPRDDRARRLDLDDEIDRAHVDAELERRRGDDRPQLAALQLVLDDHPLLAGERTVMGHDQRHAAAVLLGVGLVGAGSGRFVVQLVELGGETFGGATGVAEDDRRAVFEDPPEHLGVDAGPDRRGLLGRHPGGSGVGVATGRRHRPALTERAEVLDRDDHLDLERLADAGVDDAHGSFAAWLVVSAEELGDLLERTLCGRQPDPLGRPVGDLLEALEGRARDGAALGGGHRVDLVDDHGLDADEGGARRRGEHQVQRLGRGDQQVGRTPDQPLTLVGGRVAGAHRHGGSDERVAEPLGGEADAGER